MYTQLQNGADAQLAAIAEKSIKEVKYHLKWSSEWVIRLGDGTEESNKRMKLAVENLWMYTGELFMPAYYETTETAGFEIAVLKEAWLAKVKDIFEEATLIVPKDGYMQTGGKTGVHTEHLGYILAELQYLQRTYPGAEW